MSSQLSITQALANGDCALTFQFKESQQRLSAIHLLCEELLQHPLPQQCNVIPSKADLTLVFAQPVTETEAVVQALEQRIKTIKETTRATTTHEIAVCYHPEVAADVVAVCRHLSIDLKELITRHSQQTYLVSMLGFLPGFAYLEGNHESLNLPRKATPSKHVLAGSIAIAGGQTGIYNLASPGGWHVIGRTADCLLDWQNKAQPMLLKPLDTVRFKPISLAAFKANM